MTLSTDFLGTYPVRQGRLQMAESTEEKRKRAHRLVAQLAEDATFSPDDRDALKLAATIIAEAKVCEVASPRRGFGGKHDRHKPTCRTLPQDGYNSEGQLIGTITAPGQECNCGADYSEMMKDVNRIA